MNWKGHLAVATFVIIVGICCLHLLDTHVGLTLFDTPQIIIGIIYAYYCALLPDIDIKTSKAFKITFVLLFVFLIFFLIVGFYLGVLIIIVLQVVILCLRHRGIMHNPLMSIVFGIAFGFAWESFIVGFLCFLGYLSHAGIEPSKKNGKKRL